MPLVHEETRRAYIAQRGVSQGAAITLTSHVGGYQARFECATRCKALLGARQFHDSSTPGMPQLTIPTEELHRAITKLAETQSVALVDTATNEGGTKFVLIWRIVPTTKVPVYTLSDEEAAKPVVLGALILMENQGEEVNLDEY